MLRELSIRNFAIIDDLSISFEEGLTVLTGETGAGKSIIINAVNLILGSRASPELIRTSEDTAELEALFEVPAESPTARTARDQGFDLSEGLLIRRIMQRNGRHRVYINSGLATTHALSTINEHLASIASQHSHQSLLKPDHHLLVLDQFGGMAGLRAKVYDSYQEILPLITRLATLKRKLSEQAEHCELLEFQCNEIQQAQIFLGEDEQLEQERERLKHAERLYETVGKCVERLYGLEGAVVEDLTQIGKELQSVSGIDQALSPAANRLEAASFELEDVASELRGYLQNLVFDTDQLDAVEERLDMLQRLKRKYGGSIESVLACSKKVEDELKLVSSLPAEIAETESRLAKLHKKLADLCRQLSVKRRQAALRLAEAVQEELASLGMAKTHFEVKFKLVPVDGDDPHLVLDNSGIEATGIDRVEFLIAPNVGEEVKPLAQIASGGELSRIVLALKAMLATKESVETLIFDEVDTGIGGRVAEMVGDRLQSLARFHQVICITHLPQIARFGRHHFRIEKGVFKGRTRTAITPLREEARVKELARMLAGAKVTKKALDHAREMMTGQKGT
jgi:DNA repair protein RecN (Recombination protein N)